MGNSIFSCEEVLGDEDSGWLFNVLVFSDRRSRANCLFVTKRYFNILTTAASFRWRLERLHIEHGVHFPNLAKSVTWRSMFLEFDKKRRLWEPDVVPNDLDQGNHLTDRGENYSISVFAKFKPFKSDCDRSYNGRKAVLPLHQRLALIRIDRCLNSNKDALCVLKEQGGWFKEKWDRIEQPSEKQDSTKDKQENLADLLTSGIKMIDADNSRVVVADSTKGLREFEFDGVIKEDDSQKSVYAISTHSLVCDVVNGVSATCLVYGQTGSGKTYTMFGAEGEQDYSSSLAGIVPRACSELITAIQYRKDSLNLDIVCDMSVSFVEIFGNDVLDLLKGGARVSQSQVSAQRSVLDGNAEIAVSSIHDVMRLLIMGEAQRRKAATAMNSRSSRAHSVFIVTLKQKCLDTGKSMNSKLFLADLGGCEQTKKSDLVAGRSNHVDVLKELSKELNIESDMTKDLNQFSTGFVKSDRMREAVYINLGLMALKACVDALTTGKHVPYSSSKLTMLLSSGLGGNCKTTVIVCAAQEDEHSLETINALKFGQTCRRVSNKVRSQADMLGDLMKEIDLEISACEDRIRRNEKWIVQEEKREDNLAEKGSLEAEGFGGIEVRKTTVLVGAEDDRKLLHRLLSKKSQLSGSSSSSKVTHPTGSGIRATFGGNVGFGKAHEYDLGDKCSFDDEKGNWRFSEKPCSDHVPISAKTVKNPDAFAAKAAKKGRLAYSGISA